MDDLISMFFFMFVMYIKNRFHIENSPVQYVVRTSAVIHSAIASCAPFSSCLILTSSMIYNWTEARQNSLNIFIACSTRACRAQHTSIAVKSAPIIMTSASCAVTLLRRIHVNLRLLSWRKQMITLRSEGKRRNHCVCVKLHVKILLLQQTTSVKRILFFSSLGERKPYSWQASANNPARSK